MDRRWCLGSGHCATRRTWRWTKRNRMSKRQEARDQRLGGGGEHRPLARLLHLHVQVPAAGGCYRLEALDAALRQHDRCSTWSKASSASRCSCSSSGERRGGRTFGGCTSITAPSTRRSLRSRTTIRLQPEAVQKYSTFHPRCGTSFLMTVMLISIFVYMLVPVHGFWAKFAVRLLLLPVIAGVSYEIIRFAAKHGESLFALMTKPGLWLQRITTQPPDDSQVQCAITALERSYGAREAKRWRIGNRMKDSTLSIHAFAHLRRPRLAAPPFAIFCARTRVSQNRHGCASRSVTTKDGELRIKMFERLDQIEARVQRADGCALFAGHHATIRRSTRRPPRRIARSCRPSKSTASTRTLKKRIEESREMVAEETDPEMKAYAQDELAQLEQRVDHGRGRTQGAAASRRIRTTKRTSSWKSARARAAMRLRCSRPRSSACTRDTPRRSAGRWKCSPVRSRALAD